MNSHPGCFVPSLWGCGAMCLVTTAPRITNAPPHKIRVEYESTVVKRTRVEIRVS